MIKSNFPQSNHDAVALQQATFFLQVPTASFKFIRCRFIPRRSTPHGSSDITVSQREAITSMLRFGLAGESIPIQRVIQPISAPIPGEDPSRPIASMCRRSQSQHIEPSVAVSKAGHRPSPVGPITVLLPFLSCNCLSIDDQPRTGRAIGDSLIQNSQGLHKRLQCTMNENSNLFAGNVMS